MNRRQKIIVSVVGIFIVLLALVGLTYGYFLTRIQGNTNTTSITVTTADLELTYGDGNENIETANTIMPGEDFKFIGRDENGNVLTDEDGNIILYDSKTFTVTNNGNDTEYVVVIEDVLVTYAENGTTIDGDDVTKGQPTTFNSPKDFVYTLTCTKSDGTKCNGVNNSAFPMKNTQNIIVGNDIIAGETHNYNLTVTYLETGENQSKDMNKSLQAKVNIEDIRRINPYSDNTSSLAYNIINNSINAENGTQLMATPLTEPAKEISNYGTGEYESFELDSDLMPYGYEPWYVGNSEEGAKKGSTPTDCQDVLDKGGYVYDLSRTIPNIIKVTGCTDEGIPQVNAEIYRDEQTLSIAQDDNGTSYYYRGEVQDNYVNFANMCWRIVRIEGDGSVKLILEDKDQLCDSKDASGNFNMNGDWNIKSATNNSFYSSFFGYDAVTYTGKRVANFLNPNPNIEEEADRNMVDGYLDFQTELGNTIVNLYTGKNTSSFLKSGNWCYNDLAYSDESGTNIVDKTKYYDGTISGDFYYDSYVRLSNKKEADFKCPGTILNYFKDNITPMFVGMITADEMVFAGAKVDTINSSFYLVNDYTESNDLFQYSFSLSKFDSNLNDDIVFSLMNMTPELSQGNLSSIYGDVTIYTSMRPSIVLKKDIIIKTEGNGLKTNPYVIQ